LKLFKYRNGGDLGMKETANFIRYAMLLLIKRSEFAYALRRGPYEVNALLGGVDKDGSPSLYWLDYMGSL
jgi:20S proteasome subunit beta 4